MWATIRAVICWNVAAKLCNVWSLNAESHQRPRRRQGDGRRKITFSQMKHFPTLNELFDCGGTTVHCQWVKLEHEHRGKKWSDEIIQLIQAAAATQAAVLSRKKTERERERKTFNELNSESSWDKKRMRHSFSRFHNLLALFQLYANGQMCKCRKRLRNKNATLTNNLAAKNSCAPNSLLKWYQWFSSPFTPKKRTHTLNRFLLTRSLIHSVGWACVYLFFFIFGRLFNENSHLAFKVVNACQNEANILNIFPCCFCRVSTRVSVCVALPSFALHLNSVLSFNVSVTTTCDVLCTDTLDTSLHALVLFPFLHFQFFSSLDVAVHCTFFINCIFAV